MQYEKYQIEFSKYFNSEVIKNYIQLSVDLFKNAKQERPNVFFIGNGGSNSICSHMMEDFAKIQKFKTFSFSDPSLITCFSNDYGYENAISEWIKIYFQKDDILVSISSSGKSKNILNATQHACKLSNRVITFSGFEENNPLSQMGNINFHLPVNNYGIVECFHQVLLHTILDSINDN